MSSQRLQALSNRKLCRVAKTVAALGPKGPFLYGLVSEWLMEPVLKTGNRSRFVGSNPTQVAKKETPMNFVLFFSILLVVVIVLFCVAIAVACVQVAAFDKDEYYRPKKSEENQKENKG